MEIIAVVNLKGGTAKTTTAAHLAHVLHEQGRKVLVVDADPQQSAVDWCGAAGWPIPAVGLASQTLDRQLPGIVGDRYDTVVIDTPPIEEQRGVVAAALRVAHRVIVPVSPTPIEYRRLPAVVGAVEDAGAGRPDGTSPPLAVLLVKTVSGASSTAVYREMIAEDGLTVLTAVIPRREALAQSYGMPIERASAGPYGDAVRELGMVAA